MTTMMITTKYTIGQSHWLIESNMVQEEKVISVHTETLGRGDAPPYTTIKYKMNGGRYVDEDRIVPTKEQLLQSL